MSSTGKFETDFFEVLYNGHNGLIYAEGESWAEQRQFFIKAMRELGLGRSSMLEPLIIQECDDLCEWIEEHLKSSPDNGMHLSRILLQHTSNTIWNMLTGETIRSKDSKMVHLLEEWVKAVNRATKTGLVVMPWLKYILPKWSGYVEYCKAVEDIREVAEKYFRKHQICREGRANGESRDLIDACLEHVENCKDTGSAFYGKNGLNQCVCTILGVLIAGSETTATSINWLIFYLATHSPVQTKLQEEIDLVIGRDRSPCLADKARMPYLEAVVLETLRFSSLAPFGLFHRLIQDIQYDEFYLPKGLILGANVYHAHNDKTVWGNDADIFRPQRFLEGDLEARNRLKDHVVSFQPGKRVCPADSFAKDEHFLFGAILFQRYSFYPDDGKFKEEYLIPAPGILLVPPKLDIKIKRRL